MPPKSRKKTPAKKTPPPARRPSTRRTPNPSDSDPATPSVDTPSQTEVSLQTPVSDENPSLGGAVEGESGIETPKVETVASDEVGQAKDVVETPVVGSEENKDHPMCVETPVVDREEKNAVLVDTPVVESEKKENTGVETPIVDSEEKNAVLVDTPVAESEEKENTSVETPIVDSEEKNAVLVDTPVAESEEKENTGVETPIVDSEEKNAVLVDTPVAESEEKENTGVETPGSLDENTTEEQDGVDKKDEEEGEGKKKVVKKVKKVVTRKVVVKKVPKSVRKEEGNGEEEVGVEEEKGVTDGAAINNDSVCNDTAERMDVEVVEKKSEAVAVSNAIGEEAHDTEIGNGGETDDEVATFDSADNDESGAEAPEKQETGMDVDELPTSKEGDLPEEVQEENDGKEEASSSGAAAEGEEAAIKERQQRRKTEIFVGGLDRDAKEEDIRKVFEKAGEIVQVRLMMDNQTGRNKGYAFVRYAMPAHAKQAVTEFAKIEVCGKVCGAAPLEGNDTIFLGNIDKKWKKDDLVELLHGIGIEKIDTLTVMSDPNNADFNRGFAFLELETNRDAQVAFKKLQKKDAFGKGISVKVAWAAPHNEPDEEDMQKVRSVYAESIPLTWSEEKVKECFIKFGDIERVVLSRNMQSAKRKDYAFINYVTRESALSCIDSFDKEEIIESGTKVHIRVSLAKPVQKSKQNKGPSRYPNKDVPKERRKGVQGDSKGSAGTSKPRSFSAGFGNNGGRGPAGPEFSHWEQQQPSWRQGYVGYARGPAAPNYPPYARQGEKRSYPALGDSAFYSDPRGYPRPRMDSSFPAANPSMMPTNPAGTHLPYYQPPPVGPGGGPYYGAADPSSNLQAPRYGNLPPYGNNRPSRY